MEKQRDITGNEGWATFEDIDLDDNFNPRSFSQHQPDSAVNPFLNTNYN